MNDQELFILSFYTDHIPTTSTASTSFHLELDYFSRVSGTMIRSYPDFIFPPPGSKEKITNKQSGSTPLSIHWNGVDAKEIAEEMWGGMWWVKDEDVRKAFGEEGTRKMGVWVGGLGKEKGGVWRDWQGLGCDGVWDD